MPSNKQIVDLASKATLQIGDVTIVASLFYSNKEEDILDKIERLLKEEIKRDN